MLARNVMPHLTVRTRNLSKKKTHTQQNACLTRDGKEKEQTESGKHRGRNSQVITSVAALPKTKRYMRHNAISNVFILFQQRWKSWCRKRTDGKQKTARPQLNHGSLSPSCISRMFRPIHAMFTIPRSLKFLVLTKLKISSRKKLRAD
jgi:hypothetical protein